MNYSYKASREKKPFSNSGILKRTDVLATNGLSAVYHKLGVSFDDSIASSLPSHDAVKVNADPLQYKHEHRLVWSREDKRRIKNTLASRQKSPEPKLAAASPGDDRPPWYCHLCGKLNIPAQDKCAVCGRKSKWTVDRALPLHGFGVGSIRAEHIDHVMRKKHADPNQTTEENWAPLHFAAYEGNAEMVKGLLENGAVIEATNHKGWTPVHYAAAQGNADLLHILFKAGANPNAQTKGERSSPLHLATEAGQLQTMIVLLDYFCDTDTKNVLGQTALHIAAEKGDTPAAEILMRAGASMDSLDNDGWLPHQIAEVKGFTDFLRFLDEQEQLQRQEIRTSQAKTTPRPYEKIALSRSMTKQMSAMDVSTEGGAGYQLEGHPKEWHTDEWTVVMKDMQRARSRMQKESSMKWRTQEEYALYQYRKFDLNGKIEHTKHLALQNDLKLMQERLQEKQQKALLKNLLSDVSTNSTCI